jgi:hypothetical protein
VDLYNHYPIHLHGLYKRHPITKSGTEAPFWNALTGLQLSILLYYTYGSLEYSGVVLQDHWIGLNEY